MRPDPKSHRFTPALILLAVILSIFPAACAPVTAAPQSEVATDECGPIEPTDKDLQYVMSFGQEIFSSKDWIKSYTVEPYKISLSRHNDALNAISYIEYLIYTCGYSQANLNNYFNDQGFNVIFGGYESHTLAKFCEKKSLALYEYDLVNNGADYVAHYWVKQDTETRVLVVMIVLPKDNPTLMNQYSQKLFPDLTSCP